MHRITPLLLLYSLNLWGQSSTIFAPHDIPLHELKHIIEHKKAAHKLEFAIDIHKVLVHKMPGVQWKMVWQYPHKFELVKCLFNLPLMGRLFSMLWQLIKNMLPWYTNYKDVTSGQLIDAFNRAGKPQLAEFLMAVVNAQRVDPAMMQIIIALKEKGYPLHLASNINKQTFIKLKQRLEILHENIFAHFNTDADGMQGKTVDYTVSTAEKPDPLYYTEYLNTYDSNREKLTIFIDDKLVNILPATQQGFVGIHFKNAEQLKHDLDELGI
jgi:FMN phosphatase YigB (HAD superfamily)